MNISEQNMALSLTYDDSLCLSVASGFILHERSIPNSPEGEGGREMARAGNEGSSEKQEERAIYWRKEEGRKTQTRIMIWVVKIRVECRGEEADMDVEGVGGKRVSIFLFLSLVVGLYVLLLCFARCVCYIHLSLSTSVMFCSLTGWYLLQQ